MTSSPQSRAQTCEVSKRKMKKPWGPWSLYLSLRISTRVSFFLQQFNWSRFFTFLKIHILIISCRHDRDEPFGAMFQLEFDYFFFDFCMLTLLQFQSYHDRERAHNIEAVSLILWFCWPELFTHLTMPVFPLYPQVAATRYSTGGIKVRFAHYSSCSSFSFDCLSLTFRCYVPSLTEDSQHHW